MLWEIGKPDGSNGEFALAPDHYSEFREDGLFVVGRSDSKRDWPYVHPGPVDGWAGSREHTFTVLFGLEALPGAGQCKLAIKLLDTHSGAPPELRVRVNGKQSRHPLSRGAGDRTIFGEPGKGKASAVEIDFAPADLRLGANEVELTTISGSWMLYDWIGMKAPPGTKLAPITGTILGRVETPPVLVGDPGQYSQPVNVIVRHFGEDTPATLRLGSLATTNVILGAPSKTFTLQVPAVDISQVVPFSLEVGGKPAIKSQVTLKPVRKWIVYLLPHSHVDIGYTHVQTDVEKAQWKYLEMAIEAARKSASYPEGSRFKWNTEVLWAVDSYFRQASPEKRQQFVEAVRKGWVGLDALYGSELTGLCRPEELLQLVRCATELSKKTGVPIQSAMITDVPGYTWGMVPTFAQAGVQFFSMGPNGGDRIGRTAAAWGDKPFWWIGPNGKDKVLAWMTGTGYYQVFQSPRVLEDYLGKLESKGYLYDMVQVRHCLGDNGAPDVNFAETVKKWNSTHAYPKLVIATTAEMFRDFQHRYGMNLPVVKGDFTPYWEDGAASSARETAMNRASADRLTQTETLFAMLKPANYPAEEFRTAWRNVVLYDEHTWGAHNSISEPDAPFVKSQWAIKQAFALEADNQSRRLLDQALTGNYPKNGAVDCIEVLNTSSRPRTDIVTLDRDMKVPGDGVREESGKLIPSQRLTSGELVFIAKDIPAFGSRHFRFTASPAPVRKKARAQGNELTTSTLKLRVDEKTGAIASLRWHGNELVDPAATPALNDYYYLPGSDLKGLQTVGKTTVTVKESGPLSAVLRVESVAPGCENLVREVFVTEGLDRVDVYTLIDKKAVRSKEGVHLGFGFNVPQGEMRLDVPWAVVRPELDQIPGACKNWFTVQRWVDVSNRRYGVTWGTPDAPLVQVGGITANLLGSQSNPEAWIEHLPPSQRLYAWVMNNHWHTNYRAEQDGPTLFRFSILPHGKFHADDAAAFGTGLSQPLLVRPSNGEPLLPKLQVEPASVMVTAFKPSEDGRAYIVRLFGASGKSEMASLRWNNTQPRLWISNVGEDAAFKAGDKVKVPAYGVVTLRAEMGGAAL